MAATLPRGKLHSIHDSKPINSSFTTPGLRNDTVIGFLYKILLYLVSDGSRVNTVAGVGVVFLYPLGSVCRYLNFTDITDALVANLFWVVLTTSYRAFLFWAVHVIWCNASISLNTVCATNNGNIFVFFLFSSGKLGTQRAASTYSLTENFISADKCFML